MRRTECSVRKTVKIMLKTCKKVRKEYGMVRKRTDCIARETDFFQEFRSLRSNLEKRMLKQCWFSELRRAKSSKIKNVRIEEDGNDAARSGEISSGCRMRSGILQRNLKLCSACRSSFLRAFGIQFY